MVMWDLNKASELQINKDPDRMSQDSKEKNKNSEKVRVGKK